MLYYNMNLEDNYPYITMYKNYIDSKEIMTPWDILKISKKEFIFLYFDDLRWREADQLIIIKNRILRRSISF